MFDRKLVLYVFSFLFVTAVAAGITAHDLSSAQNPIDPSRLSGQFDATADPAIWHGVAVSGQSLLAVAPQNLVLGSSTSFNPTTVKRIEVDLTNQRLYAFEDGKKVYDFLISSGLWGKTPTGEFTIWAKPKYTLMTGGSKALSTYYYLPNVPFVQFFYNDSVSKWSGFSLHGTYWHSNFGHPMSHGCINMKTSEAETIFYWTNPTYKEGTWAAYPTPEDVGTKITIYGTPPAN
ncbi:MAG: L,D-transpeptidase [candidate division WWE3 bacterium]|nr:L,D-transpeptidase [candidate division WWE3 bacterium]